MTDNLLWPVYGWQAKRRFEPEPLAVMFDEQAARHFVWDYEPKRTLHIGAPFKRRAA